MSAYEAVYLQARVERDFADISKGLASSFRQARRSRDLERSLRRRSPEYGNTQRKKAAKKVAAGTLAGSMALTGGVGAVKAGVPGAVKEGAVSVVRSVDQAGINYARNMGNTYHQGERAVSQIGR